MHSRQVSIGLATALVFTMVGGVAVAVDKQPSTARACVTSAGALRVALANGKCGAGQSTITLGGPGQRGPRGPRGTTGRAGATGAAGPQGATGPAGSGIGVTFSQAVEPATITHFIAQDGGVSIIASCQGTAALPSLVFSISGAALPLTYTATEISSDAGHPATTAIVHSSTASLQTKVFDTETTTAALDNRSDVVTLVVNTPDSTQVTATFDVEVSSDPAATACTVGGTVLAT